MHNKGGLYNRLTEQIELHVFSLKECEDFVKSNELAFNFKLTSEFKSAKI